MANKSTDQFLCVLVQYPYPYVCWPPMATRAGCIKSADEQNVALSTSPRSGYCAIGKKVGDHYLTRHGTAPFF
ncbi:Aspartate--tRNA(Asp/Asn) ligase [Trichinella spiralis]|uniref:Aspartate--tRNA(Asp/Asn) ligase n=1 Tax=Trichinella spiralis TaxID=6334 RepID=A0ABR3KC61_TRISP